MNDRFFNLAHPQALQWLWALLPLAGLFAYDLKRRQAAVRLFVSMSLLDDVNPGRSLARPIVKYAFFLAGLAALIFAAAQPRWNPHQIELTQQGQNILFALDVSNSMRARDVDPSRLEAAKAAIRRLIDHLPAGHQVGLLAYAGSSELKVPLTPNYSHFRSVLEDTSYNSVDVGGSNLGDAIYQASSNVLGLIDDETLPLVSEDETSEAEDDEERTHLAAEQEEPDEVNVLIVLTDGENHEGHAKEMAVAANKAGLGLYIIGLGTEAGGTIPIEVDGEMTTLKYKGEPVVTKFQGGALQRIVDALPSRSGYLAAGASNVDLIDIYKRVIAKQGSHAKQRRYTVWQEKFQLFVGLGLVLLVISGVIKEQKPAISKGALS